MPFVADDAERTESDVRRALRGSDLLVTIGGASVGEHDLVRPAMAAADVTIDFWGVAIKPGKPVAVGRAGATRVLCLPGNPASATLTFLLFGVPLLRAMQGEVPLRPRRIPLRIIGAHARRPGREEYLRARLEIHDDELCAVLLPSQASGAVTSFAAADALVVLAAGEGRIEHGDRLPVIQLAELWS
jgi:molybdopterin molybdotransferase